MNLITSFSSKKSVLLGSLILAFIAIYPNIGYLAHDLKQHNIDSSEYAFNIGYLVYRFVFFWVASYILLFANFKNPDKDNLAKRLQKTFLLILAAYIIYAGIAHLINRLMDCFGSTLILQFIVVWLISGLIGHIYALSARQLKMEEEFEQLKIENLQSRYEALSNQINPHFFFNSLNSLNSLIREDQKELTLKYTNKLSSVFRYILQSEKKGLVNLDEELQFLEAYRYLLEIRYANKITFLIEVEEEDKKLQIPVLSLLPLIENVVKHNIIDSDHPMQITVTTNKNREVVVSNPIHEKTFNDNLKTGIGLTNLGSRFSLLMDKHIRTEDHDGIFKVFLPLKEKTE